MGSFSLIHWIILGLFLLLLFGGNRFSNMMKDVAKGLKGFKEGLSEDDKPAEQQRQIPPQQPIDVTPSRPAEPRPGSGRSRAAPRRTGRQALPVRDAERGGAFALRPDARPHHLPVQVEREDVA